jgi:hypothetical protein
MRAVRISKEIQRAELSRGRSPRALRETVEDRQKAVEMHSVEVHPAEVHPGELCRPNSRPA